MLGGAVEFSSGSIHLSNAIRDLYALFEEQSSQPENRGRVPVVACTGADPTKDKYGTNYRPRFGLLKWVDRPAELPDTAPVEEPEVWNGGASAQAAPRGATHVPLPVRNQRARDPALETEF